MDIDEIFGYDPAAERTKLERSVRQEEKFQEWAQERGYVQVRQGREVEFVPFLGSYVQEQARKKLAPVDAVSTGFPMWNSVCRDEGGGVGLARGWHVVIAGNTGMGKSLMALNLGATAVRKGERVGMVSLEMSCGQTMTRFMSIFSGIPVADLEHGKGFRKDQHDRVEHMLDEHFERTGGVMLTNTTSISNLQDIVTSIRRLYEYEGVKYIITDYLQLAWVGEARNQSDRITEVSHAIRAAANDLGLVSVGVSQFNRMTSASGEKPIVQGLMGGSALENDSNQVILLDHTTYEETAHGAMMKVMVAKNRHGPNGDIPIQWDYRSLRANECDPREFEEGAR